MKGKLLMISTEFPPLSGGISVVSYHLAREAIKHGFPHTIVLTTKSPGYQEFDLRQKSGIEIIRVGWDSCRYLKAIPLYIKLKEEITSFQPEVLLATSWLCSGSLAYLNKDKGMPYFNLAHGLEIKKYLRNPFLRNWMRRVFKEARLTFAVSRYTSSLLLELGITRDKIVISKNGVDLIRFKPMDGSLIIEKHNLKGRKVLLTVGRLVPYKGQDLVIRAIPLIKKKVPNISYLIVGEGPDKERLRYLIKQLRLEAEVKLVGMVPDSLLPLYYNACDIFLMVNRMVNEVDFEGFGLVFLEAGACGKPVIASVHGGVEDAVIDGVNGILLPQAREDLVAEAAVRLIMNPALAKRLGEGGRRVAEGLGWDKVAGRIFSEIKKRL